MPSRSLTVAISVYNEAPFLKETIETVINALKREVTDYEILIIDDASQDDSFNVATELSKIHKNITVIRNQNNLNFGGCLKRAISLARKEYFFMTGGDNRIKQKSLRELFKNIGQNDKLVLFYIANNDSRYILRYILSRGFVIFMNLVLGANLRYYNGPGVIRTELLKNIKFGNSNNFAIFVEAVAFLIKKGYSCKEIPMLLNPDPKGQNLKAIFRNFFSVIKMAFTIFWRIRVKKDF